MTPRSLAAHALFVFVAVLPTAADASTPADGAVYHIRTTEPRLRALVEEGVRCSPTFRALVQRLIGSDVVVYLRSDAPWHSRVDGRMTFAAAAGGLRYVVVRIREQRTRERMLALIAHELRHAVEVADTPAIVDTRSLGREYERMGYVQQWTNDRGVAFDTDAAVDAGFQVLAEVKPAHRQKGRGRHKHALALDTEQEAAPAP